jgi:glycosyl transferase family 2
MTTCAIGVQVHSNPSGLLSTLAGIESCTRHPIDLYLVPDEPDASVLPTLRRLVHLPQLSSDMNGGAATCFNRLAMATDTDVVVLLESGLIVGPGWLDHLLLALAADPANGLAGPSTNRAWNEQQIFPRGRSTPNDIGRTSAEAAQRFTGVYRTLEPLYSLADFCYAVRRDVITAIGGADEDYGRGPCWEMDYNLRAARAGWRGVWACAAYVFRSPPTQRRLHDEALWLEPSKHRYQDKFCGRRLRKESFEYESHCRGDDCADFAPADLIQLGWSLAFRSQASSGSLATGPLVSCIMPTRNRRAFALQAIRYYQRQDYAPRELIILDDGSQDLTGLLPSDPTIRYYRLPPQSIGTKRNLGCELARGSLVALWDDDDWYGPTRLTLQVSPILSGEADITGLTARRFFELEPWRFWTCTPELHRRLFVHDVAAGTLAYHRRVWERLARYPDRSLAEDASFLRQAVRRGGRVRQIPGDDCFAYVRHGGNSWRFSCGRSFEARDWTRVPEPALSEEDRAFYAALSPAFSSAAPNVVLPAGVR